MRDNSTITAAAAAATKTTSHLKS